MTSSSPASVVPLVRERHAGRYRAAVVPAIADIVPVLPAATLALADEASIEISRFDVEMEYGIAPFGPILLRSESVASSRIEKLSSGAKAIALAALGGQDKRNAAKIVANVRAMELAIELAGRLDEDAVLAMHSELLGAHHPDLAVGGARSRRGSAVATSDRIKPTSCHRMLTGWPAR